MNNSSYRFPITHTDAQRLYKNCPKKLDNLDLYEIHISKFWIDLGFMQANGNCQYLTSRKKT